MKKRLDTSEIGSQLSGSVFFRKDVKSDTSLIDSTRIERAGPNKEINHPTQKPSSKPITQPAQPINHSANRKIDRSLILGKPKGFYITEKQDRDLDTVVEKLTKKLEGKINQKVDRSTVIRLLIESSDIANEEMINKLASQLISRLISQLTD